jgi:hypothetical protein
MPPSPAVEEPRTHRPMAEQHRGPASCRGQVVRTSRLAASTRPPCRGQYSGAGAGRSRLRASGRSGTTRAAPAGVRGRCASTSCPPNPCPARPALAVAYWLCAHPGEALSPTGQSSHLGFAPSTISTATAALADAGLVDEDRRAVQPELFWELASAWQPQWTWLAARPDPEDAPDGSRTWVLTGDRVAAAEGAPLMTAGEAPLELFVPDAVSVTLATRRYGSAAPGTVAAAVAVAVAPTRQVLTGQGHLDGWPTAPVLAVALGLAGDPARGREVLQDWPGRSHVWALRARRSSFPVAAMRALVRAVDQIQRSGLEF